VRGQDFARRRQTGDSRRRTGRALGAGAFDRQPSNRRQQRCHAGSGVPPLLCSCGRRSRTSQQQRRWRMRCRRELAVTGGRSLNSRARGCAGSGATPRPGDQASPLLPLPCLRRVATARCRLAARVCLRWRQAFAFRRPFVDAPCLLASVPARRQRISDRRRVLLLVSPSERTRDGRISGWIFFYSFRGVGFSFFAFLFTVLFASYCVGYHQACLPCSPVADLAMAHGIKPGQSLIHLPLAEQCLDYMQPGSGSAHGAAEST
jgi:hypothetical protein